MLFDGQGSERTVTNVSQSVQGSISYDAFGQPNASSGSSTSAYMFASTSGYRSDGDSGLILVGCRYYDPQVGRFVTRDTYLDQHPYLYCNGDPVNFLDPTGHASGKGLGSGEGGEVFPGARRMWPYVKHMLKNGVEGAIVGGALGGAFTAPAGGEGALPGAGAGFVGGFFKTPLYDALHWLERKIGIK